MTDLERQSLREEVNTAIKAGGLCWVIDGAAPSGGWMLAWDPVMAALPDEPGDVLAFRDGSRGRMPKLNAIRVDGATVRFQAEHWHEDGQEATMAPLTIAEAKKRGGDLGKLVETFDPANPEHQAYFLMEFRP